MKKIIISPYSSKVETLKQNAKNYPYFNELIQEIRDRGNFSLIQIGINGEKSIGGCDEILLNLSFRDLSVLINNCYSWISVDNFFHHFAWAKNKRGNVIFGPSDPNIFGHKENNNILKNRKYLAQNQFDLWENIRFNEHAFDKADIVVKKLDFVNKIC